MPLALIQILSQGKHRPDGERVRGPGDDDAPPPERPGDQEDASHAGSDAAETQLRHLDPILSKTLAQTENWLELKSVLWPLSGSTLVILD